MESTKGARGNSAHFESRLKSSAGVQIALKHVHDIEWLICIKKKKRRRDGGMKGGQGGETEGTLRSSGGQNPLDLRLLHVSFIFNL